jgi:hypothetical protein
MDIHPPTHPILSFKEALVHLGIVTVGILIALSLEGLLEWRHHVNLVHEARENMAAEIRDNDNELQHFLQAVPQLRSNYTQALDYLQAAVAHQAPARGSVTIGFSRPELTGASWTTAQTIGALGLMNYQDVKRYAAVYELQNDFIRLQSRTMDAVVSAMTTFQRNEDPAKLPAAGLQSAQTTISAVMSGLQTEEQIGQQLHKRYQSVLSGR